nr:uncharacterized protein LOC113812373 [Penaeus vannamei]
MEIDDEVEVAVAKELDSAGCIAKLLCEIEATPADSLTPSMSTFKTAFENPDNLKSSRIEYDQAIALAKDDPKACSVRFDKCRLAVKSQRLESRANVTSIYHHQTGTVQHTAHPHPRIQNKRFRRTFA